MYVLKQIRRHGARAGWVCITLLAGCGFEFGTGGINSTLNLTTLGLDSESTLFESSPNGLFELAEAATINEESRVIRGSIDGANDVDIYDLGPAAPGDRFVVSMTAEDTLAPALAAFDEDGTCLLVNDHRNVYLGVLEPFIDVIVRKETDAAYIAISATPGFDAQGDYALLVSKERTVDIPPPESDTVLLVFNGDIGVRVGSRSPVDVPRFDAVNVSSSYVGQTDLMVEEIVARVRDDYDGFDVTILSTSEGDRFQSDMTRIFFGTYDEALLGVAEGVDEFNATTAQEAMIFTDTFAAFMPLEPTVEEMAQAIANVTSHEIGHLMGLVHTSNPQGIMDVTASLFHLLGDQTFNYSSIYAAVFPLGNQNAVSYLLNTVGGDFSLELTKPWRPRPETLRIRDDMGMDPVRTTWRLSSCCLTHGKD